MRQVPVLNITLAAFATSYFWGLSNVYECLGVFKRFHLLWTSTKLAVNHQTICWWGRLWIFLLCVICGTESGTDWCHLTVFSFDGVFHTATWLPILYPYIRTCGIGYVSKKLSKVVGNLASYVRSYSFNSWSVDRAWIATELWGVTCKYLFFLQDEIFQIFNGISKYL